MKTPEAPKFAAGDISVGSVVAGCIQHGASDIHLSAGSPPTFRRHGTLEPCACEPLAAADLERLVREIGSEHAMAGYAAVGSGDCSHEAEDGTRFRVSIYRVGGVPAIAMRRIPSRILGLAEIGLPEAAAHVCDRARGLFLVTGPTGSGKTTSLAALVDHINERHARHIVTFEDPVEYRHVPKRSLVHQREIGSDAADFPAALRASLRQDPDVILVGEMRDLETIRTAVRAAETGHLVLATVHTTGAAATVNRIIDAFPGDEQEHIRVQLSCSLAAVLSQALCPRADGQGVVAAYEFMLVNKAIAAMLRKNKPFSIDDSILAGRQEGMQLLDDHLLRLAVAGTIDPETAVAAARDPVEMPARLRQVGLALR